MKVRELQNLLSAALIASAISLVGCAMPLADAGHSDLALAKKWVHAVESRDWELMNSLLSASAIYEDPTMVYFDTDAVLLQNREAIVDFWRQSSIDSGAQNISYQIESCFESGGVSVLNMQLSLDVSGSYWGIAKDRIHLTGKQTTCITVVDDLIVHVVDYVEYARVFDVVNELRAAEIHD